MKLEETTLDQLKIGEECIYRNIQGNIRHVKKVDKEKVEHVDDYNTAAHGTIYYTGQSHKVWKILD